MSLTLDEGEFAFRYAKLNTAWPAIREGDEPEPTHEDLNRGWDQIMALEASYRDEVGEGRIEALGTAIAEAVADWGRAGYNRKEIEERISEMIQSWDWSHFDEDPRVMDDGGIIAVCDVCGRSDVHQHADGELFDPHETLEEGTVEDDEDRIEAETESLDQARAKVIQEIVDAEDSFAHGSVSGGLLEFFQWLNTNTDIFDPVMVQVVLDMAKSFVPSDHGKDKPRGQITAGHTVINRDALKLNDEEMKDLIKAYLEQA